MPREIDPSDFLPLDAFPEFAGPDTGTVPVEMADGTFVDVDLDWACELARSLDHLSPEEQAVEFDRRMQERYPLPGRSKT
jgi:hypothetical protein